MTNTQSNKTITANYNLDHLPSDVRAFIYQNTSDLEKHLLPGSQLTMALTEGIKKDSYKAKFTLQINEMAVDAVGTADNPFDAIKQAKEKMYAFLGDVNAQVALFSPVEVPKILH